MGIPRVPKREAGRHKKQGPQVTLRFPHQPFGSTTFRLPIARLQEDRYCLIGLPGSPLRQSGVRPGETFTCTLPPKVHRPRERHPSCRRSVCSKGTPAFVRASQSRNSGFVPDEEPFSFSGLPVKPVYHTMGPLSTKQGRLRQRYMAPSWIAVGREPGWHRHRRGKIAPWGGRDGRPVGWGARGESRGGDTGYGAGR